MVYCLSSVYQEVLIEDQDLALPMLYSALQHQNEEEHNHATRLNTVSFYASGKTANGQHKRVVRCRTLDEQTYATSAVDH